MANTENCPKVGIVMGSDSDMMYFLNMQKVRRKKASR